MTRRGTFAAGAAAALGGVILGAGGPPGSRGRAAAAASASAAARIPDVPVTAHDGRRFRFYSDLIKGKIVLLNVMFVGCGDTCPLVTANLVEVQRLLGERVGRDIFMYSITLRPELETPMILADYALAHGVGPGWLFLTGAPADIDLLRRRLGFSSPVPEEDVLLDTHTGLLRYGNDRLDRWAGGPALAAPEGIALSITSAVGRNAA